MIHRTTCLSDSDWENLHGNDSVLDIVDYIKEVPEFLVYYQSDNVYGHVTYHVYFESPIDMQNFIHFYNTDKGIKEIGKEK